ncbi:Eukaryotic translation initiation factor 2 subunit 2 [Armadillidium vulgare]|nr:Eukaryotic translation initiation factor 2 subunit 2 [Armadillidium vulgare]
MAKQGRDLIDGEVRWFKNALPDAGKEGDEGEEGTGGGMLPVQDMDEFDMDFSKQAKKKKKKPQKRGGLDELLADEVGKDDLENNQAESGDGWYDSDRDYTYDELLQRAFNQLRERNPDMATGEKKKFVMKPPQVVRIGSKKSAFANFTEICRLLHRIPKHLLQFLLAELGTSGSIDGKLYYFFFIYNEYIKEYVTCHTCRSPDTILQKDARLYFLQCEQCNSRCSVAPIKSGFQAVANKQQRQAIRASKN